MCVPRARDEFEIFSPKTPSVPKASSSYQEGQREDCEIDFQTIVGEFSNQYGVGVGVFVNPLAYLGNQVVDKGTDQEGLWVEKVMTEDV